MPRIWTDYCQFLSDQCFITRTRKACDRALRSLPITQHNRVWPIYLKLVETYDIPETGVQVYKRYSKVNIIIFVSPFKYSKSNAIFSKSLHPKTQRIMLIIY